MLMSYCTSAPNHTPDQRTSDLHATRGDQGVNNRLTWMAASPALPTYRVPWAGLTSPLLLVLFAIGVALVAWSARPSH